MAIQVKKHIKEVTAEYLPFWEPAFKNMGLDNPAFYAKLGYNGGEFGSTKVPCVRFWPSELNSGQDCYIELFDWDQLYYSNPNRILYRLKSDSNWEKSGKFAKVDSSSLSTSTYAIRISDLDIVNLSSSSLATSEVISAPKTKTFVVPETTAKVGFTETIPEPLDSMFEDTDAHMSNMTLKDHYCITHNVPMSDKNWLNQLILNSRKWLSQQK